ncbi:MAG: 6-carboxyhexanoate--CoA ligase [Nitrospirae bacterium]|nr:MAG: 6-carboxyhexanoate--CoA ligase [Nitrospirota bacterium]
MWSIRMRASKKAGKTDMHVSGAEGLYTEAAIGRIVKEYSERAFDHPRGKADRIVITIEEVFNKVIEAKPLDINTIECPSPKDAKSAALKRLGSIGVSKKAASSAFRILESKTSMRGASVLDAWSGKRLEPDKKRGIRASMLGIEKKTELGLKRLVSKLNGSTNTILEALILASKVASCPMIIAEICISDDPDYTTGYVASRSTGYTRIKNMKQKDAMHGGRVFFAKPGSNITLIKNYLEQTPVIISNER